jgi:hypothetical protein
MKTSRLSFVRGSVGVCVAGVLTAACGGDDESEGDGASCTTAIAMNHGHSMQVTAADIDAGAAKTYDIKGSATHSHTVALTADDFKDLTPGSVFSLTSSVDAGHSHDVTITC